MKELRILPALLLAAAMAMFCGCGKADQAAEPTGFVIYYENAAGTALCKVAAELPEGTAGQQVEQVLQKMRVPENSELRSAIPEETGMGGVELQGGKLDLDFDENYLKMDRAAEVLCRSALVRTLSEIDGVEMVRISVDGEPIRSKSGEEIGYQQSKDFVQNTGSSINSFQDKELTLYFADQTGMRLKKEIKIVRFNTNTSLEQVIIERLIKGPGIATHREVIPPGTKLLSASVNDRVCYLNFDESFLTPIPDVLPEVAINGIVNSVCESELVDAVKISVNGESEVLYQESINLGKPLLPVKE